MDSNDLWVLSGGLASIGFAIFLVFRPMEQETREGAIINPWKRYFARTIDQGFYILIWGLSVFLFALISAQLGLGESTIDTLAIFVGIGAMILAEPIILSKFQTTLGKTLFKLKIQSNEPITFGLAMNRWLRVVLRLIPITNLIAMPRSYRVLKKTGDTAYDRNLGITITSEKLTSANIVVIIFVVLISLALNMASNFAMRDDIKDDLRSSLLEDISQNTLTVQEELDALVVELRDEMGLPQTIDEDTELSEIGSGDLKFIYFYTLTNYNYDELDIDFFLENLKTDMRATQKDFYCNNENLLWYRENNVALEYRYSSADGLVIGENIHYSSQCP